jgi:hypothetical protein
MALCSEPEFSMSGWFGPCRCRLAEESLQLRGASPPVAHIVAK